jgi:transcriptional regulator with PAS, ATPase and Fis domain
VNCAEIPESLLEGEILGYEKAIKDGTFEKKLGKLELASGGTLFLNEIGEMNSHLQEKLAHILRKRKFDLRIITATNRNLRDLVTQGVFSKELYALLNGVELHLLPLREHKEDVLTYAQSFILKYNRKLGKSVIGMTTRAEQILLDYYWPGNIRELKNVLERAMDSVEGDMLDYKHFVSLVDISPEEEQIKCHDPIALDELEKRMIRLALQRYGNSVEGKKRAAGALNISLATLYNKLKTL